MSLWNEIGRDYERHGRSLRNFAFWAVANYRFGRWASEQPALVREPAGRVITDLPADTTAIGVPARAMRLGGRATVDAAAEGEPKKA